THGNGVVADAAVDGHGAVGRAVLHVDLVIAAVGVDRDRQAVGDAGDVDGVIARPGIELQLLHRRVVPNLGDAGTGHGRAERHEVQSVRPAELFPLVLEVQGVGA